MIVHALLLAHHVGHHVADLVVHERHAGLVRRRAVDGELRHAVTPFGVSRPRSLRRLSKRRRERSKESSKRTTFSDGWDQMGCSVAPGVDGLRRVLLQPALHRLLVLGRVGLIVGEHAEQGACAPLLAGGVGLAGAHDRRRDEVALQGGGLHDEPAPEQLADELLEHDRGREQRLAPVADAGEALDQLARRLPDRVVLPGLLVDGAVEAVDLLRQREVVEDQVLREAQLVRGADGHARC